MAVCPERAGGLFCAMNATVIMDNVAIDRALARVAHEILERNFDQQPLALIGIRTRGAPLARRLAGKIGLLVQREMPTGELDITMHRDDLALRGELPRVGPSSISFDVTDRTIVLVDDVLFTGRTIRAALDRSEERRVGKECRSRWS